MADKSCDNCRYFTRDWGIFTATGWTGDGSKGYCGAEPKQIRTEAKRPACRKWESKEG